MTERGENECRLEGGAVGVLVMAGKPLPVPVFRPFYPILHKIAGDRREILKKAFFNIFSLYRCSKW